MANKNPNQTHLYSDDEIDLKKVLKILINGKLVILIVTIIFVLASILNDSFFTDPVYESTAVIAPASITNLNGQNNYSYIINDDNVQNLQKMYPNIDQIVELIQVDQNSFKDILASSHVLDKAIKKLSLQGKLNSYKGGIQAELDKENKKIIHLTVQYKDPQIAADLANALISEATNEMESINDTKMYELSKSLNQELQGAQLDLDKAYKDLKNFQAQSGKTSLNIIDQKRLESEVSRREYLVNSLNDKILQVGLAKSLNAAENKIVVLSPAMVPETRTAPKTVVNASLFGCLGLVIAAFFVFFRHLYNSSNQPDNADSHVNTPGK
jgi:Capsular polysaccharide biosynthesis protein